jgi:molybdopterin converting factor subunit 1
LRQPFVLEAMSDDAPSSIEVLLFASAADAFGAPSVRLPLRPAATVGALRAELAAAARAAGGSLPASWRIAVNERFADLAEPLRPGDEVAIIPPVAGG